MKAQPVMNERSEHGEDAFAQVVVWQAPQPLAGSAHPFKYRLAFVVSEVCVLRYDNEAGKGDHRHMGTLETAYVFTSLAQLLADFFEDIVRWKHENHRV